MNSHASARGLSSWSRVITVAVALFSGVLGAILFVTPGWAAPRFAWNVSELVVMSIGAWFIGRPESPETGTGHGTRQDWSTCGASACSNSWC